MTFSQNINAYSPNAGITHVPTPIKQTRSPTSSDSNYPIGQSWIDQVGLASYDLVGLTTTAGVTSATWAASSGGTTELSTLTGDTGTATPAAGNIKIAGTANQITTAASGATVTISVPSTFVAPGSIAATTSLTATLGNITATAGNIVVTAAANGIVFTNAAATSGTTTATINGRVGQVTITTPSIAAGATATMTITNSAITGSSTQVMYALTGGTTGAALTIQSYANTANQSVVTIQNGTGATTNTASLILNFIVIN